MPGRGGGAAGALRGGNGGGATGALAATAATGFGAGETGRGADGDGGGGLGAEMGAGALTTGRGGGGATGMLRGGSGGAMGAGLSAVALASFSRTMSCADFTKAPVGFGLCASGISAAGGRHRGRQGRPGSLRGRLGGKFLVNLLLVDFADRARDRLGIRRDIAALLEQDQHVLALHVVALGEFVDADAHQLGSGASDYFCATRAMMVWASSAVNPALTRSSASTPSKAAGELMPMSTRRPAMAASNA